MRRIIRHQLSGWLFLAVTLCSAAIAGEEQPTNVILVMSDDQGWGDVGYNGHKILKTPHLDAMAGQSLRFNRFYSSSPVCSPTRGSCLTGRHPYRYGILYANAGGPTTPSRYLLPKEEITLAEVLAGRGYRTGHFGKWHLGDFVGKTRSAPSDHGFDEWFSTARKVATLHPDAASYRHNGYKVEGPLKGDDSKIIMDKAIPFIRSAVEQKKPFFAVIWFHTPHLPILAAEKHRKLYPRRKDKEKHYWGALTAMDEQVGRLRETLRELDVARDTMLWFTSDNGPEGKKEGPGSPGTTGGLRGRKRSLFEGGVRVPGILEWPARIAKARQSDVVCSTQDYFPTVLAALGIESPDPSRPLDGVNLLPLIAGADFKRGRPLAFQSRSELALIDGRYKLHSKLDDAGKDKLYDLSADPTEKKNLAGEKPALAAKLRKTLEEWQKSTQASMAGADYRK